MGTYYDRVPGYKKYRNQPVYVYESGFVSRSPAEDPSRYGNWKMRFDSTGEYDRYCELQLLEKAGEISELARQQSFVLIPKQAAPSGESLSAVKYVADFVYKTKDGRLTVEDFKGNRTAEYKIKRKMMLFILGIEVIETTKEDL